MSKQFPKLNRQKFHLYPARDRVDMEAVKQTMGIVKAALQAKGVLLRNVHSYLESITPPPEGKRYVLVPMNLTLWLYALGCNDKEKSRMFISLAKSVRNLLKNKGNTITLSAIPIGRNAKNMLYDPDKLANMAYCTYQALQSLLVGLVCASTSLPVSNEGVVHDAIQAACPTLDGGYGAVGGNFHYTAAYNEKADNCHTSLLQVCPANAAILYTRMLLYRAASPLYKNFGTQLMSREHMMGLLCGFLAFSQGPSAADAECFGCIMGQEFFF